MANKSFAKDDEKDLSFEERQLRAEERRLDIEERRLANENRTLELQEQGLRVQKAQLEQTKPKSLAQPPNISPFNLRGQKDFPMPRLKCEVYCPWKIDPNLQESSPQLDREEVELFNLLEPGERTIELNDGSRLACTVVGVVNQENHRLEKLSLMGKKDPDSNQYATLFTKDNKSSLPSLKSMLRQMLEQQGLEVEVVTMKAEARKIVEGAVIEKAGGVNPYPVSVGA